MNSTRHKKIFSCFCLLSLLFFQNAFSMGRMSDDEFRHDWWAFMLKSNPQYRFYYAVKRGDLNAVRKLIQGEKSKYPKYYSVNEFIHDPDLAEVQEFDDNLLSLAIRERSLRIIRYLVEEEEASIHPAINSFSILDNAISNNDIEIVRYLWENGVVIKLEDAPRKIRLKVKGEVTSETENYLRNVYLFQRAEDKLRFILDHIHDDQIKREITDIIRLAFCASLRVFLNCDVHVEETLFEELNEIAQRDTNVKNAIFQAFNIRDENLLKKKNWITFVNYAIEAIDLCFAKSRRVQDKLIVHGSILNGQQERQEYAFGQKGVCDKIVISTRDRIISGPKLFLSL